MNIYIEKMYMIVAVWSLFLFSITLVKAFQHLFSLCCCNKQFIEKHLSRTRDDDDDDDETNKSSIHNNNKLDHLRPDEILVLKLIKANASDYDLSLVIRELNKMN